MAAAPLPPTHNRLLGKLDRRTVDAILPQLSHVALNLEKTLYEEGKPIRHVYFPTQGVVSLVAVGESGDSMIEVGTIGREGMVGIPLFLGVQRSAGLAFVQVAGEGWRMSADDFLLAAQRHPALVDALRHYTHAMFVQAAQSTGCNRLHGPLERCARWLLSTGDRVDSETFDLKQEFLGQMLGERRATVSRVASQLRRRGLISYSRGHVKLLDRPRLEEAACRCYWVIREAFDGM